MRHGILIKMFAVFFCAIFLIVSAFAQSETLPVETALPEATVDYRTVSSGRYTYLDYRNGTAKILSIQAIEGDTDIRIPESIDNNMVIGLSNAVMTSPVRSVHIPKTIVQIDGRPFLHVDEITVDPSSPFFKTEESILYSSDGKRLIFYPPSLQQKSFVVPDGVELIAADAFFEQPYLEEITLPSSVLVLDDCCFAEMPRLHTVHIAEGLVQIRDYAFYATALQSVSLPATLRSIGRAAFLRTPLQQLGLQEGLSHIGAQAFGASKLTEITMPSSLQYIGKSAFQNCESLKKIDLNEGLQSIDNAAFSGTAIETILLPHSLDFIGEAPFANCKYLESIFVYPDSLGMDYCKDTGLRYEAYLGGA